MNHKGCIKLAFVLNGLPPYFTLPHLFSIFLAFLIYYLSFFSVRCFLLANETCVQWEKDVTYVLAWFYLHEIMLHKRNKPKKKRWGGQMLSLLYRNVRTQCKFLQITVWSVPQQLKWRKSHKNTCERTGVNLQVKQENVNIDVLHWGARTVQKLSESNSFFSITDEEDWGEGQWERWRRARLSKLAAQQ